MLSRYEFTGSNLWYTPNRKLLFMVLRISNEKSNVILSRKCCRLTLRSKRAIDWICHNRIFIVHLLSSPPRSSTTNAHGVCTQATHMSTLHFGRLFRCSVRSRYQRHLRIDYTHSARTWLCKSPLGTLRPKEHHEQHDSALHKHTCHPSMQMVNGKMLPFRRLY